MPFYLQLLLALVNYHVVVAFSPNHFSDIDLGNGTLTHFDITKEGILRAVAAFFEENPRPGSTIKTGDLTEMDKITARKLITRYYGADASSARLDRAIDKISRANNMVDIVNRNMASWSFSGEAIVQGNKLMVDLREQIINVLSSPSPNFDQALEQVGQFLHVMQMFYSNTNWVEMNGPVPYTSLGIQGRPLYGTAPSPMDTCKSCWHNNQGTCKNNLLVGWILTSGYRSGQDIKKPFKDPKTALTGKCSHGGPSDSTSTTIAALGGINKESNSAALSPHHHLHKEAAKSAIAHTVFFFNDKEYGLRHVIGNINYQRLLKLKAGNSMALVIDSSGSMSDDIEAVKLKITDIIETVTDTINEPSDYIISIFNDPLSLNEVSRFETGEDALAYVKTVQPEGGGDCPEYALDGIQKALTECQSDSKMYVFTDASAKDPEKKEFINTLAAEKKVKIDFLLTGDCGRRRKRSSNIGIGTRNPLFTSTRTKRQTAGLDVFESIASASGGTVYLASKSNISYVADVIKESALGSTVTILKRDIPGNLGLNFTFPVDTTVRQISIKIKTPEGEPLQKLISPNGSTEISSMSVRNIGSGIKLVKVESPMFGDWRLQRLNTRFWTIEITAQSTLDISTTFVKKDPENGFEYEIDGRPIAGDIGILIAKLPSLDMVTSLKGVILLNSTGSELKRHDGFTRVGGREESAVFRRQFQLPGESFDIAISGTDSSGNDFLRLVAENIVPVHIELKILAVNDSLYVNESLSIPYEVTNKGDASSSIKVILNDDQKFAQSPVEQTFHMEPSESMSSIFWLQAGPTKGVTTKASCQAHEYHCICVGEVKHQVSSYCAGKLERQHGQRTYGLAFCKQERASAPFVYLRWCTETSRIDKFGRWKCKEYSYKDVEVPISKCETDTKVPVCDILSVDGTCDVTIIDPCLCSQRRWFARTEVGDDGFGLFQVLSTIGDNGTFNVDKFTMGHTIENGSIQANISATCCDAVAYINVVDLAGNTGQCVFNMITQDGEAVTNTSIMDMVKIRDQCTSSTTDNPESPGQTQVPLVVIIGIAVGVAVFVMLLTVCIACMIKKSQ